MNIQTIEDLYKIGDGKYPWLEYINDMTAPIARFENHSTISVDDSDFPGLVSQRLNKTDKRTVANFMIWRVISQSVKYLPDEYREQFYEFSKMNSKRKAFLPKPPL